MQWRTNLGGTCLERQQYRFSYDYANRLTAADHWTHNGTVWTNTNNYSESNITFDLNGNIKTYTRRGLVTAPSTYGVIDQLTYTYGDAARPDRLTNMADVGSNTKGFFHTPAAAAYQYDLNGNMTQDNHKGFTFAYNFLNLPQTMTKGASVITMTYTADGEKLSKAVTGGGATKNYVGGIEYAGANLEAIYFGEGRCTPNGATAFNYDYTVKDHLGNARVNFRANGTAITVLESMHYYPFGMLMEGIGTNTPTNDYTYNGKELNEDFGLNLSDYGARWYDASLGRWWSVDPMADSMATFSPYNYVFNCPMNLIDPDGTTPGPGDKFKSPDAAAKDWASTYNHESMGDNKERSSAIYKGEDSKGKTFYSYTPALTGAGAEAPDVEITPEGTERVADIHSHAAYDSKYDNNNFSPVDKQDNRNDSEIGYLVTPSGSLLKYDPKTDKVTVIAKNMPSDSSDPSAPAPPRMETPPIINVSTNHE